MTDLLGWAGALDVDAKPCRHLSDRALVRVLHNINSKRDAVQHWVWNRTKGEWLNLRNCDWIQKEESRTSKKLRDDEYKFPTVSPFDPKKDKVSSINPILTEHGSYTAWKGGTDDVEEEEEDGSGSEEEDNENRPPP
ncbi:unnamed protein product [Phytophthora fragariaefolia]|uniref:Unnamed protein product n=1 Tax=Phytophthora fragariaefolia TaxID=1490495 RepID=A0A9W6TWQ1_9STRA|nr:unnamed protein product [Phytophthora fragariaefolia]